MRPSHGQHWPATQTSETRTARLRLAARPKPYCRVIETGLHLGYRRGAKGGGTWVARRFIGERRYSDIEVGTAYDLADGVPVASCLAKNQHLLLTVDHLR